MGWGGGWGQLIITPPNYPSYKYLIHDSPLDTNLIAERAVLYKQSSTDLSTLETSTKKRSCIITYYGVLIKETNFCQTCVLSGVTCSTGCLGCDFVWKLLKIKMSYLIVVVFVCVLVVSGAFQVIYEFWPPEGIRNKTFMNRLKHPRNTQKHPRNIPETSQKHPETPRNIPETPRTHKNTTR